MITNTNIVPLPSRVCVSGLECLPDNAWVEVDYLNLLKALTYLSLKVHEN